MKVLLVYPEFPDTYWSFRHALAFEGRQAAFPPLGLLTVSASWESFVALDEELVISPEKASEEDGNIRIKGQVIKQSS